MKNEEKNLIIILGVLCITLVIIAVVIVAKVYQNKIESNKQAESIKEQVSAITTDNEKNTTRPINTNTTTTNTNATNSNKTTTNTNTTFQNTTKENTTTSNSTTSSDSNKVTSSETEDSEIIGKWNTQKVSDLKANETYDNLKDLYGSSYLEFGSYLQLNDDGTFVDAINPVTDGSTSTVKQQINNYILNKILRSYNKLGDCYVELTYSDGRTEMLQRVYYDNTETPYLTFNSGDLSYILKK